MKRNGWQELYKRGFRARYPNEDVIRFIGKNFPEKDKRSDIKVLDFGFGTGRHIIYLAREGFDVFGVEVAKSGIELTERWLKEEGLKADLRQIDGTNLPFPDEYFDAVIDCASIQHNKISEIEEIILEIHRVLKRHGKAFSFCKSTRDSLYGLGEKVEDNTYFLDNLVETPTTIHFFDETEIVSLWKQFSSVEIEYAKRTTNKMTRMVSHFIVSVIK